MDSDEDDWLFESIKKYRNLSMYDLQKRVTTMDWVESQGLCVATSDGIKHEILELVLPDKLLADASSQGLKKDRDFRVQIGGFCSSEVTTVKHLPQTRHCITADKDRAGLTVWSMGNEDTDLMQKQDQITVKRPVRCDIQFSIWSKGEDSCVTHGSSAENITTTDLKTKLPLHEFTDLKDTGDFSGVVHINKHTVVVALVTGEVHVLDLRCRKVKVNSCSCQGNPASFWTLSKMTSSANQSETVLQLSSSGEILLLDIRCMDESVSKLQTNLHTDETVNFGSLKVQGWCNSSGPCVSVSGFDSTVALYKLANASDGQHRKVIEPFFLHTGHSLGHHGDKGSCGVTCHMWHPWQQDLVLSADTSGSLHAWQYSKEYVKHST